MQGQQLKVLLGIGKFSPSTNLDVSSAHSL